MPYTYTVEEKVQIIKWYYSGESADGVVGRFAFAFENRPVPSPQTVLNIAHKFEESGCVTECTKCAPHQRTLTEQQITRNISICAAVETNDPCSSGRIADEVDVPPRTVRRVLRKYGYKPFHVSSAQELLPDDEERRLVFCETMRQRMDQNDNFVNNILFSDESSFFLKSRHNRKNVVYWSTVNEHLSIPIKTQFPQKINVWTGFVGPHLVGPFFIQENLTAQRYLDLLQGEIIPALNHLPIDINYIWFQQDGCPAHNSMLATNYIDQIFQERVISTYGTIRWPPRSPDLAPNDFFLWGYLKGKVYAHLHERAANLDELRIKITRAAQSVTPEMLNHVRDEFYHRLTICEELGGTIFEPLIR